MCLFLFALLSLNPNTRDSKEKVYYICFGIFCRSGVVVSRCRLTQCKKGTDVVKQVLAEGCQDDQVAARLELHGEVEELGLSLSCMQSI